MNKFDKALEEILCVCEKYNIHLTTSPEGSIDFKDGPLQEEWRKVLAVNKLVTEPTCCYTYGIGPVEST